MAASPEPSLQKPKKTLICNIVFSLHHLNSILILFKWREWPFQRACGLSNKDFSALFPE